ncbi:MAG TPA: hypothetical protein VLV25_12645 [Steroidobacteraceae bacterium]|nr:hypothetical protein [Steroidobacteraceae bacterium]
MKAAERRERAGPQRLPAFREEHEALGAGCDGESPGRESHAAWRAPREERQLRERHAIAGASEDCAESFAGEQPLERAQVALTQR